MINTIARQAIARIAEQEGISENKVIKEMEDAILKGHNNPATRQKWDDIFGKDTIPNPEEFIAKMYILMQKNLDEILN